MRACVFLHVFVRVFFFMYLYSVVVIGMCKLGYLGLELSVFNVGGLFLFIVIIVD